MQLGGGVKPEARETLTIGGIELDDRTKEVTLDGEKTALTPTEYDILKLLMENPGKVYSPAQIYAAVWNDSPYGTENTVAVHIRHLRENWNTIQQSQDISNLSGDGGISWRNSWYCV